MFKKMVIANRGEIACRIIRAAKAMGIETVAVFSSADTQALHVQLADSAHPIGNASASESYLNIEKIIETAVSIKADAIHPGYGFLAESQAFAAACQAAGLTFIGPSPEAIALMGDKEAAKAQAETVGLPIASDYRGPMDVDDLATIVSEIGLPVLVKATAGGGGKGMRLVLTVDALPQAIAEAQREAKKAFGDDRLFIEKYIDQARHIEVQIAADTAGHVIHLFDRDCSAQRRHQKIIEEAPAQLNERLREQITQAACQLAAAIDYTTLGTVEFLVDANDQFYFMEMNTRLQVEHPITEMVTGIDCVQLQIQLAYGTALPYAQADVHCQGHAIEARLCAEDPLTDFMPVIGTIEQLHFPQEGDHLRIDTGIQSGARITPYYDSLLAKVIAFAPTRAEAIDTLKQALAATRLVGIKCNREFLLTLLAQPALIAGQYDTGVIEQHLSDIQDVLRQTPTEVIAIAALITSEQRTTDEVRQYSNDLHSPWMMRDQWRTFLSATQHRSLQINQATFTLTLAYDDEGMLLDIDGHAIRAAGQWLSRDCYEVTLNERTYQSEVMRNHTGITLTVMGRQFQLVDKPQPKLTDTLQVRDQQLLSPMPGTVVSITAQVNEAVCVGQTLMTIEAMKMEYRICAPADGCIKSIFAETGMSVQEGEPLIELGYD